MWYDVGANTKQLMPFAGTTTTAATGEKQVGNALFAPLRGSGPKNAEGLCSRLSSIYIRMSAEHNNLSATNVGRNCLFRLVVLLDKQANAADPTAAEIWDCTGDYVNTLTTNIFLNMQNRMRFQVLLDKTITQPMTQKTYDSVGVDRPAYPIIGRKYFLKFKRPLDFTWTDGAIADAQQAGNCKSNNISVWILNDQTPVRVWIAARMRFGDGNY